MIIVTGKVVIDPADVDAAKAAVQDMVQETVRETGCLVYEFSQIIGSPNAFRVYEEWRDLPCLEAHFQTGHMARFREALSKLTVVSRDIERFEGGPRVAI